MRKSFNQGVRVGWPLSTSSESSGETALNRDNSRVTTVDRDRETAGTSSPRRKDGGGWRIWLTPLWSSLGKLVKISHRPSTYVEHDGKRTQTRATWAHRDAYRDVCTYVHAREGHGSRVLVHPSGVPLGFSLKV